MSSSSVNSLPELRFLSGRRQVGGGDAGSLADKALALRRRGRSGAARLICHQALLADPMDIRALELAGLLGLELGHLDEACDALERARALEPDKVATRRVLGRVYRGQQRFEAAAEEFQAILDLCGEEQDALEQLARMREKMKAWDPALDAYRRLVAVQPENVEGYERIGALCRRLGRAEEELEAAYAHLRATPDLPAPYRRLLQLLNGLHRYGEAVELEAEVRRGDLRDSLCELYLGDAHGKLGNADTALERYRAAVALDPDLYAAWFRMGAHCLCMHRNKDAETAFREAIRLRSDDPGAYANLGLILGRLNQPNDAEANLRRALEIDPRSAQTWNNLAIQLMQANRAVESIEAYEKALECDPEYWAAMSNLCFNANYVSAYSDHYLFTLHRQWGERFAPASLGRDVRHANSRDPERRLRVGYVSPDFCSHVVSRFLEKVFASHDPTRFDIFAYANVPIPDRQTAALKALIPNWRSIVGLSVEEVVEMVRADGIDILVDLAGHTAGHRLQVFAYRPAPVQVTWLGYPNTTGVEAMDYRLTDSIADPPGRADEVHSEELVRLPHGFLCWTPPQDATPPGPPPMVASGYPTFGCFNNLAKQMPEAVALWCEVLRQVPEARVILKAGGLGNDVARDEFFRRFELGGVDRSRVQLFSHMADHKQHLALYGKIDIAFDPFPYNGTTTTCDSLWMGVPVVTYTGDRHAARVSASILHTIGLPELVGVDKKDYVDIAVALARDPRRLGQIRLGLRERIARSPLTDGPLFTRDLEEAYRTLWRRWCAGRGKKGIPT